MKESNREGTNRRQSRSDEVVLSNGVRMAARLNHVGYAWLQSHYDKPLMDVWADSTKITEEDGILAFMALVVQANSTMPKEEIRQAVLTTSLLGLTFDLLRRGGVGGDTGQVPAPRESILAKLKRRTKLRRKRD